MSRFAVVAIGYNRVFGIMRLLKSLENAFYDESVDLIISIDNSGSDAVEKIAKGCRWSHGKKKIITYPERNGLRKHILRCGDFLNEYDAIAVFEDDIIVSEGFFPYMKCAAEKYGQDEHVAGISLYSHLYNVNTQVLFEPAFSEFDAYFFQYAQSWGQVWMKKQWFVFKEWYLKHDEDFFDQENIPANVCHWPKSSWLKYHIKYCIENNKYFVYPYKSLTTCCADVGEHNKQHNSFYQVPLLYGIQKEYHLPDFNEAPVKYDAFFERVFPFNEKTRDIPNDEICIDLYASKPTSMNKRYVLSTRILPYKTIASFSLDLRPIEMNVILDLKGNGIYLYDTNEHTKNNKKDMGMTLEEFRYRWRLMGKTKILIKMVLDNLKSVFLKK